MCAKCLPWDNPWNLMFHLKCVNMLTTAGPKVRVMKRFISVDVEQDHDSCQKADFQLCVRAEEGR